MDLMNEIGYHDCDWISFENKFEYWGQVAEQIHPTPLELHIPCRDPINYLLSMCNYQHREFNCANAKAGQMAQEVNKCQMEMYRFYLPELHPPTQQWFQHSNISLKCYNAIPIEPYLQYMGTLLQPKRIVGKYVHRDTNKPRNKEAECLLHDLELQEQVKQFLISTTAVYAHVFKCCHRCMGTKDELFPSGESSW